MLPSSACSQGYGLCIRVERPGKKLAAREGEWLVLLLQNDFMGGGGEANKWFQAHMGSEQEMGKAVGV